MRSVVDVKSGMSFEPKTFCLRRNDQGFRSKFYSKETYIPYIINM